VVIALGALALIFWWGGAIWLAYEGFKKDAGWGVAALLFAPFVALPFASRHLKEGRRPAATIDAGFFLGVIYMSVRAD
jgi:hypothetical protein